MDASRAAQLTRDTSFGFLDATTASDQLFHPVLISNHDANTMARAITAELRRSTAFTFSVAFVTPGALALLKQALIDFDGRGTIITSTYLGFNSPAVFRELLNLPGVEVRIHNGDRGGFHAKGYLFDQTGSTTAIIGSSNLTESALLTNHEWNLRFSALPGGDIVAQLNTAVRSQVAASQRLTPGWIDEYARSWTPPPRRTPLSHPGEEEVLPVGTVIPNRMQVEALTQIAAVREAGEQRAVVVSATGTGKTILAALDVRAVDPDKMLFIVHREQILDRAIEEFQRVLELPRPAFGKLVGATRELDRRFVFATIQSLSRPETLAAIDPQLFDHVLIDEVHRAGAASYGRVLDHLRPAFVLGLTATPERTDGFNVFELFDHNVPYEIRLQTALEEGMLAPFHYYGVTDYERDGEVIDELADLGRLVAPERVTHLLKALETYGHAGIPVRGLMFCSRNDEAGELSRLLNASTVHGELLRTRVLTGDDPIREREEVVAALEAGELDYILTVDIFNEGIDIPTINQVVMLRQTASSIIFTQQLGRGLRKAAGKEHLIVIDLIGNYANNYLIPVALFGNTSLNKESLRRSIIDAQEAGSIAGLSSVNFDEISRQRIFDSIANTKLDSMVNLKRAVTELEQRLGHPPRLMDFARFDTADPVVLATKKDNYWQLLRSLRKADRGPTPYQNTVLTFLSMELLNGKRPHELLVLKHLLETISATERDLKDLLSSKECSTDPATLRSVERILSLAFFTDTEQRKYGDSIATRDPTSGEWSINPVLLTAMGDEEFAAQVQDVLETGLHLARHRYRWSGTLEPGKRYSRKDACRLLNWENNEYSTMYGYKTDHVSQTVPIFITYHKTDEVTETTKYGDEFINESEVHWFTRSRRTLASKEVQTIVRNELPLHLFVKKDDVEGTDFYYLGRASASNAEQTTMPGAAGARVDVVTMTLGLEIPVEPSLYDYLRTGPVQRESTPQR